MSRTGLQTAVEDLGGIGDPAADLQPGLFEPDDVPMPVAPVERKSGPQGGRPKGARNRSTEEWRQYILSRYRSPLVALMEIASRSPKDLAKELELYEQVPVGDGQYESRLATGEAFKRQMEALQAALPYLHQKQPLAIEPKGGAALGLLMIGEFGDGVGADGLAFEDEQNQGVIECDSVRLDEEKSDGHEKPCNNNQLTDDNR